MIEAQEWLYRDLRAVLETSGCFVSDDIDERLMNLTEVVLGDPRNSAVQEPKLEVLAPHVTEDAEKQLRALVDQRETSVIFNILTDEQVEGLADDWNEGRDEVHCAYCGEQWPCTGSTRRDISPMEIAKHRKGDK